MASTALAFLGGGETSQNNMQDGPVLLVGHSYGGVVITEAGNNPKVAGLVYVAAFAPEEGETLGGMAQKFPLPPGFSEIRPVEDAS